LPTGIGKSVRVDTDQRRTSRPALRHSGIPAPQPNFGSVTTLQMR
jgi:hypothetical protein